MNVPSTRTSGNKPTRTIFRRYMRVSESNHKERGCVPFAQPTGWVPSSLSTVSVLGNGFIILAMPVHNPHKVLIDSLLRTLAEGYEDNHDKSSRTEWDHADALVCHAQDRKGTLHGEFRASSIAPTRQPYCSRIYGHNSVSRYG